VSRSSALVGALIYLSGAKAGLPVLTANRDEFDIISRSRPRVSSFISERERKVQLHRNPLRPHEISEQRFDKILKCPTLTWK